jgi:hypothetical protein
MNKQRSVVLLGLLLLSMASCFRGSIVSYKTVQSFRPAEGSIVFGYSGAALNAATKLSEVRSKCGTPLQEWEERRPFFDPKLKHLKYKTYDPNNNVLVTVLTFVETSTDPPLIQITHAASDR